MLDFSRVTILTGHFGSGKTELAINFALNLKSEGIKTTVIDLDIVNPFFRSGEKKDFLESKGIRVITPNFVRTGLDIPSLPSDILSVFHQRDSHVIFDVGGDETGAKALSQYNPHFLKEDYRMYYVINTFRPLSSNKEDILSMLDAVEINSRLKVTHLINNSNLSHETTIYDIMAGYEIVKEVSDDIGLPISYISGKKDIIEFLPRELKDLSLGIEIFMRPPWES